MDALGFPRRTLMVTLAMALLTNCTEASPILNGGFSPAGILRPPQTERGYLASTSRLLLRKTSSGYKVSKGLIYVALTDPRAPYDEVNIYATKENDPALLAAITDGVSEPQDACIDGDGTLYVTNQGSGAGWISVYALGSITPNRKITQGINGPAFCTIDNQGNLWVTNLFGPNVTEYQKGSSEPRATITDGLTYPIGIAIDHHGNLYVANHVLYGTTNVQVFPPGSKSPKRTITDGVEWPAGIAVDAESTLYVTNLIPGNVEEYRIGRSHPYREISRDMNGPSAVTFSKSGWAYITNTGAQGGGSGPWPVILEFPPGSLKPSSKEISSGLYDPLGTAYYPPLRP